MEVKMSDAILGLVGCNLTVSCIILGLLIGKFFLKNYQKDEDAGEIGKEEE